MPTVEETRPVLAFTDRAETRMWNKKETKVVEPCNLVTNEGGRVSSVTAML